MVPLPLDPTAIQPSTHSCLDISLWTLAEPPPGYIPPYAAMSTSKLIQILVDSDKSINGTLSYDAERDLLYALNEQCSCFEDYLTAANYDLSDAVLLHPSPETLVSRKNQLIHEFKKIPPETILFIYKKIIIEQKVATAYSHIATALNQFLAGECTPCVSPLISKFSLRELTTLLDITTIFSRIDDLSVSPIQTAIARSMNEHVTSCHEELTTLSSVELLFLAAAITWQTEKLSETVLNIVRTRFENAGKLDNGTISLHAYALIVKKSLYWQSLPETLIDQLFSFFVEAAPYERSLFAKLPYATAIEFLDLICIETASDHYTKRLFSEFIQHFLTKTPAGGYDLIELDTLSLVCITRAMHKLKAPSHALKTAIELAFTHNNCQKLKELNIEIDPFETIYQLALVSPLSPAFIEGIEGLAGADFSFDKLGLEISLQLFYVFATSKKLRSDFLVQLVEHLRKSALWSDADLSLEPLIFSLFEQLSPQFPWKREIFVRIKHFIFRKPSMLQNCTSQELLQCITLFGNDDKANTHPHQDLLFLCEEELVSRHATNKLHALTAATLQDLVTAFKKQNYLTKRLLPLFAGELLAYGRKGFDIACMAQAEELAIALVRARIDLKTTDASKKSALHMAVMHQLFDLTKVLLEKGENCNAQDQEGNSPLHLSCLNGNIKITELLLKHNANPVLKNTLKQLPLIYPAYFWNDVTPAPGHILRFYRHIFERYPIIMERLRTVGIVEFIPFLASSSNLYMFNALHPTLHEYNPLKLAFLLQPYSEVILGKAHLGWPLAIRMMQSLEDFSPAAVQYCASILFKRACQELDVIRALHFLARMTLKTINEKLMLHCLVHSKLKPVLEEMCSRKVNVNCSDSNGNTLLHYYATHIDYDIVTFLLKQGADPLRRNVKGETPFQNACSSSNWLNKREKTKHFCTQIFADFPAVQLHIEFVETTNFPEFYYNNPDLLLNEPHIAKGANPLEIAAFLCDRKLAAVLHKNMSEERFSICFEALKKKYPNSDFHFIEYARFSTDLAHLTQSVKTKIPERPPAVVLPDLLNLFNDVNFTEPSALHYFRPDDYHMTILPGKTLPDQMREGFTDVILQRRVAMTPPTGTAAHKKFYEDVENALLHTIRVLKTSQHKAYFLGRCAKLIGYCAGALLPTSLELYDQFVIEKAPSFAKALFEKLGDLRRMLLESLVPKGDQNTHYHQMLLFKLSGKNELNLPYSDTAYDDRVAREDAVDIGATKARFFLHYQPEYIIDYIELQLEQDGSFRDQYIAWWQEHLPATFLAQRFEPLLMKAAELEKTSDGAKEIEQLLEKEEVPYDAAQSPFEAIYATRATLFNYELRSAETGNYARPWIIRMLQELHVIAKE